MVLRQVRPSKSCSTGPRQYSSAGGGAGPSKRTRNATSSESASLMMSPGLMLSLRPVSAAVLSAGMRQKGVSRRGKNSHKMSAIGSAWAETRPA